MPTYFTHKCCIPSHRPVLYATGYCYSDSKVSGRLCQDEASHDIGVDVEAVHL